MNVGTVMIAAQPEMLRSSAVWATALAAGRGVVDDLVEDRPKHRGGALLEKLGALLEPQPGAVQVAARSLAHCDDEALGEEHRHLAELDLLMVVEVAGRAQDDEEDP